MPAPMHRPLLPLALLLLALPARAEELPLRDLTNARGYALAGAFRSLGLGAEAVGGNPAAMSLFRAYRIELSGGWDTENKDALAQVTLADSSSGALAGGVNYTLASVGRGAERRTVHLNTLALAFPLMERVLIGGSVRYAVTNTTSRINAATGDLGLLFRLGDQLTLGVSGHNLIGTQHEELARYYSGHVGFLAGLLVVGGDVQAEFPSEGARLRYAVGAEYVAGEVFPLRAGFNYDAATGQKQIGAGVGILSPEGGIDLGFRQDLGGRQGRMVALTLKLQVG